MKGFIAFYEVNNKDSYIIKEKLILHEKKLLQLISTTTSYWFLNKWAAAVALILAGGITYLILNKTTSKQEFQPYEEIGLPNYMGPSSTSCIDWKNIMVYYKTTNFQKITALKNENKNDTLMYFQGIAWFKQKKFQKGIQLFEKIPSQSIYYNKGNYFKALGYYKLNNTLQLRRSINKIKNEPKDPSFNEKVKILKKTSKL